MPAIGAAVLATVIGFWVLKLWNANLRAPLYLGGDNNLNLEAIKDILEHGWYLTNHSVGAPFGQQLYDYPAYSGDSLYLVMLKIIGLPFSNAAAVENLFFLLCFPLITISAYAALRALGISVGASIVCAVLYTLLPVHFFDGEQHLFLASYFTVPLGCYLVLRVFRGDTLFSRDPRRSGVRSYLTGRSCAAVLACAVMGCSDNYYAAFTVALLALAALFAAVARRSRATLLGGLGAAVLVLAVMGLNGLPNLIYTSQHGKDPAVGQRQPLESDLYGLTLADLVLPIQSHRIKPFGELTTRYQSTAPAPIGEGHSANLGLIGTLGLLWLAIVFALRALGARLSWTSDPRQAHAALAAGFAFLIATVGGLGLLFAYVVSPQLRAWNRISVFIAFFALLGVGFILDRIGARLRDRRLGFAAVLGLVLVVGALDQTSPSMAPPYKTHDYEYFTTARFVAAIQRELPSGSAVFQLPYVPFPENPPVYRMEDYSELEGYLDSSTLSWSYGQLKGLPLDWEATVVEQPLPLMVAEISAAGFKGIYIDTYGYGDNGASITAALTAQLGVNPTVSGDGRLYFFNMAAYNMQLRTRYSSAEIATLANAALYPLTTTFGSGFYAPEAEGLLNWHWAQRNATIEIVNRAKSIRTATLTAQVASGFPQPSRFTFRYPEGTSRNMTITSRPTTLTMQITLRPGKNELRFSTSAPATPGAPGDTRRLHVKFDDTTLIEPAVCLPVPSTAGATHPSQASTLCSTGPQP